MGEPGLAEKVVAVHRVLTDAGVPNAIGGALALAYYAEPRATVDIDVNVFVDVGEHERVLRALASIGVVGGDPAAIERDGQVRLRWGRNPVDLFFAYHPFHHRMREWHVAVPFADTRLPILAAEHLMVCKAVFNRAKDWIDIEQMTVGVPDLDADEVRHWLGELVGEDDDRWQRVDAALRELLGR